MRSALSLPALSLALAVGVADPAAPAAPARLAVYYGYPSLVNGAHGDLDRVAGIFSDYDVLVLGDGLEFDTAGIGAGPAEHAFTLTMLNALRARAHRPVVFGYVDLGHTQRLPDSEIERRVALWAAMRADGVFFDEAGYDFGVTRDRQNRAVAAAHDRGLRVCVNAFRPQDLFETTRVPVNAAGGGNPDATPPLLAARDAVLLESFGTADGVAEGEQALTARWQAAVDGRSRYGTSIYAVATTTRDGAPGPYAWWLAAALGIDAFGWSDRDYGAGPSRLTWVPRPAEETTLRAAHYLEGRPSSAQDGWHRRTTAGAIVVDARARSGGLRVQ